MTKPIPEHLVKTFACETQIRLSEIQKRMDFFSDLIHFFKEQLDDSYAKFSINSIESKAGDTPPENDKETYFNGFSKDFQLIINTSWQMDGRELNCVNRQINCSENLHIFVSASGYACSSAGSNMTDFTNNVSHTGSYQGDAYYMWTLFLEHIKEPTKIYYIEDPINRTTKAFFDFYDVEVKPKRRWSRQSTVERRYKPKNNLTL